MKELYRLSPHLWRSIDYEQHYFGRSDKEGRLKALTEQMERLEEAQWLQPGSFVSFHIIDWDIRQDSELYNNHVPIWIDDALVQLWFAVLGMVVSRGREWMRGSLTHHAFDYMGKRDPIEIILSTSKRMSESEYFYIERIPLVKTNNEIKDQLDEQCLVKVNISKTFRDFFTPHKKKLAEFINKLRHHITSGETGLLKGISLYKMMTLFAQESELVDEGLPVVQDLLDFCEHLSELNFENSGVGAHLLMGCDIDEFQHDNDKKKSFRNFLLSVCLLECLTPRKLMWNRIGLVPGVSCLERDVPEAAEGFFIVMRRSMTIPNWRKWLLLANLWAREKAVFDLKSRDMKKTREIDIVVTPHDLKNTLNQGVLQPLINLRETVRNHACSKDDILENVSEAINCVEHYQNNWSFLLDGFADSLKPLEKIERQSIAPDSQKELLEQIKLNLDQLIELPEIHFESETGLDVVLQISKKTFHALLHMLLENAIGVLTEKGKKVSDEKVIIRASLYVEADVEFCKVSVWNSGTELPQFVIDKAGHRPYTRVPRENHAGLGLFIVNHLLSFSNARHINDGRYFNLKNPKDGGAEISFSIVIERRR
jgi:hypothetical protein